MPRLSRTYLNTEYFHVMTQGINKSYIFNDEIDIKLYIKNMYELNKVHDINIISYCIMGNHAHMLLNTKVVDNLSKYMHDLNTKYACYYNNKNDRVGYVFRDRFKAEGIYSEKQLFNCIKYIYDNPVKAGICEKPEDYPYTNYKFMKDKISNFDYDDICSFTDIDENSEEICTKVIEKFLHENNYNLTDLKIDNDILSKLVVILKKDYNISLRNIAINLKINRERVRRIYVSKGTGQFDTKQPLKTKNFFDNICTKLQ